LLLLNSDSSASLLTISISVPPQSHFLSKTGQHHLPGQITPTKIHVRDLRFLFLESLMNHDLNVVRVNSRAVDVGYFNVKYTTGRVFKNGATEIGVGLMPSLAPRLSTNAGMHSPGTSAADGCIIEVNGVRYFVGRGAVFNSSALEPRPVLPDYPVTAKYLALLRGALNYMAKAEDSPNELVIEHLVVGLPLNNFTQYKDVLKSRVIGEHIISLPESKSAERRVTVEDATVIVQPQGALVNFGTQHRTQQAGWLLVVDPGGGTLDWFLSNGRQPNWQRSGAYSKSMLACATAVCDRINPDLKNQFEIVERIDEAIRTKAESFKIGPKTYPLKDYWQTVESILDESIRYMLGVVGATENLDRVLLTGGGATVFYDHMQRYYPKLAELVSMDDDPVFSNVKGFQVISEMLHSQRGGV
jgi:plasmid segregation protein ParM